MNRRIAAVLCLALFAAGGPAAAGVDSLTDLEGRSVKVGAWSQDTVVAVFFATWSPRCRGVAARAKELEKRWGDRATVVLIAFQEEAAVVEKFLAGDETVAVYLDPDGAFSKEHAITFLPGLLVLKDGRVAFRGRLGEDPDAVLAQILDEG